MPIDIRAWKEDYKKGCAANADKLVREFKKATGIMDKATTDEAIKAFIERVVSDLAVKKRTRKMREITDRELHDAMEKVGRTAYTSETARKAEDAGNAFEPYAREIERILPTLAAREIDARTNVLNRVIPLAVGLQEKKKEVEGV